MTPQPPTGLSRILWRLPIWLYRLRLGWLMGNRFMLINHIGRKSGQVRQAVVEVARYDKDNDTYYVCSGFGKSSNWYRNIEAHPQVNIQVGKRHLSVTATCLSPEVSGEEMVRYAKDNPKVAQSLLKIIGHDIPADLDGYRQLAIEHLPFVAFTPLD